jgi:hypothetical protein
MASFAAIVELIYRQVENRALYPTEEALLNGVNPAMRLLCLMDHMLHTERVAVSLAARRLTVDLRQVAARSHRVLRVLLGDATADTPALTLGQFAPLLPITRERLACLYPDWLRTVGVPSRWFLLGRHFVCVWPRPMAPVTLTLVCATVPPAAALATLASSPALDESQHAVIADLATPLLLYKEGAGEADRAVQQLRMRLGAEPFTEAAKRLRSRALPV